MFNFSRKKPSKKNQDSTNSRTKIEKLLNHTTQFLQTTTGTITSLSLLLGATSSLGVALGSQIPAKDNCPDSVKAMEHLGKLPLKNHPYTIENQNASVKMEINVYQNGDILTTYGSKRKWLCFPEVQIANNTNPLINFLIPQAIAQTTISSDRQQTTYIQEQTLSPHNSQIIEQTRIYSDGTVEKVRIDRRTGIIFDIRVSKTTITPELQERLNRGVEVEETTVIEVEPQ